VFVGLYKKYVRPHLEFASPAWSPWLLGDISVLEQVQEKALRSVAGLKGTTYLERCREVDPGDTKGKKKITGHDTDIQDFERNIQESRRKHYLRE
jgi:hypothetical protein